MTGYYDSLETRDPEAREDALFLALPQHIAHAKNHAPGCARILAGINPAAITNREALATLPVTRKSDLIELHKNERPFGGLNATAAGDVARIYASPGPIYDPEGRRADYWRLARALFAAGFRKGDIIHNTFAYHFTPAGFMLDLGAQALGCAVIPAGVGQTELQVQTIADLRPNGYAGTPSFLKIILEKGRELSADLSSLKKALVSAEALPPALRAQLKDYGVPALQCYASADIGLIAYESEALQGMIVDEHIIIEIVRPGSGEPVPEGEVGEVVVTTLNPDYPLIRFGTGDLSAVLPGASPCGRTNLRIKGWMGRADQTTKVKGMFVQPTQVAQVMKRHPEIIKARLVVDYDANKSDRMIFHCETHGEGSNGLREAIISSIREVSKLRGEVAFKKPGELPNDGKVIEDARKYD
ncbi:MAG: phenylacetate--CoA ligase family protein [Burkholderiales bacterium]